MSVTHKWLRTFKRRLRSYPIWLPEILAKYVFDLRRILPLHVFSHRFGMCFTSDRHLCIRLRTERSADVSKRNLKPKA